MAVTAWCGRGQAPASKLPQTAATTLTAQTLPAATSASASASSSGAARQSEVARKAQVTWAQGELTIAADDASLNQILIEITRQTGMKVTGGVKEERVYGEYGPGAPGPVLASLLLGTGSNMLLKENAANGPVELVLSPRAGGVTPPGPLTYARNRESQDDLPPQQTIPRSRARTLESNQAAQAANGQGMSPQSGSALTGVQAGGGQAAEAGSATATVAPAAAAPATTEQQSPNGVKTPQQIYDQLMKMQQQKAAAQAAQQHVPAATPQ